MYITQGAKTATQKPKILCDGRPIAVNGNVKYLGLWITKTLTLTFISKLVELKIAYAVGKLNKLKCYFPKKILLQLYHVLIYPHLFYAIPMWVLLTNLIFTKFQFSTTKLLESVSQTKWNFRANPSYTNVKVLKHYQYGAGKIMYNLYHKQHPCKLNQYFTKANVRHSRPTRSSTFLMFTIPFMKSTKLQPSFLYQSVKTWNSIPHYIKISSFSVFNSDS